MKITNIEEAVEAGNALAAALNGPEVAKCWEGNPLGSCLARNKGVDPIALARAGTLCLPCETFALATRVSRNLYHIRKHQTDEERSK